MRRVSGERHSWTQRSNDDFRALFRSSYLCSVSPSFSGSLSLRVVLVAPGSHGPYSSRYPRQRRAVYFPIHPRKGFQPPHLLVNPYYGGARDAVLHWPKLIYVSSPTSSRGVPAWRSRGGRVCLERHRVDFHWKEGSTQKGLWKEKYSSYPPVCPSSQTFTLSLMVLREGRGRNWWEEKHRDHSFERKVPVGGVCRWEEGEWRCARVQEGSSR